MWKIIRLAWLPLIIGLFCLVWPVSAKAATSPYRPFLIGQGVELHGAGIVIGDGEVLLSTSAVRNGAATSARLDQFLKAMKQSFDALEFRIQTDIEMTRPDSIAAANAFIHRAHDFGLQVGVNYWRYPNTLNVPAEFQAKKLDDSGRVVNATLDDDHVKTNHIEKANPAALAWFRAQLKAGLATVPDFDFYFAVEDKLSSWVQTDDWPQRVRYWDSPTYSQSALASFQAYLIIHDQGRHLFPVDRRGFVRSGLTEYASPNDPLWAYWYTWRFEVFAQYLKTIKTAVQAVHPGAKTYFMSWQRTINEAIPINGDDWNPAVWTVGRGNGVVENAIFGVSAKAIAAKRAVHQLIIEYGEDGTHWGWPMSLNRANARIAFRMLKSRIGFGSFLQMYNYSDRQHVIPELVFEELQIAKTYNARTLVLYDVATLFERSARYDAELTAYWRANVAWNFTRFNDLSLITIIRRELLKAEGKRLGLDPNRPGPPSQPAGVGSWYDRNGTIYISTLALKNRTAPFYVVADHWSDPLRTPENWLEAAPDRGYIAIHRPDLISQTFQVIDRYARWAQIAETPGVCGLKGVICQPGTWLFKPVSWTTLDWTNFGWKP